MEAAERALELAREAIDVPPGVEGRALPVRRLDRPGEYYLVVFEGQAVAAVDPGRGETLSWAVTRGRHLAIDENEARRLARAGAGAETELVWRASAVSRSPLYPVWEVRGGDTTVYVDQQGGVSEELRPTGRGG